MNPGDSCQEDHIPVRDVGLSVQKDGVGEQNLPPSNKGEHVCIFIHLFYFEVESNKNKLYIGLVQFPFFEKYLMQCIKNKF